MMEVIQNDSSNPILLLDLLPRKCLVFNPDYLKTFYKDTELENYRQLIEKALNHSSIFRLLFMSEALCPQLHCCSSSEILVHPMIFI